MDHNNNSEAAKASPATEMPKSETSAPDGRGQKRKRRENDLSKRGGRIKRRDMGREEYFRSNPDRRQRNADEQSKRQERENEGRDQPRALPVPFSKEEIANDERKPKRKVAVMLSYSGSGYKGMQFTPDQRTVEGDLFSAFVAAGAISKANADDPKKSSFVRCARTDKGVHAAGNVISLKLIIEDPDIIKKINDNLSPQIRVWGIERTPASFSCYQVCDSRQYEYLIPTYCFLPPHPHSFLGKKLVELAEETQDLDGYKGRQEEVADFWDQTDHAFVKPILDGLDEETRRLVEQALYHTRTEKAEFEDPDEDVEVEEATEVDDAVKVENVDAEVEHVNVKVAEVDVKAEDADSAPAEPSANQSALDTAIKSLKAAYIKAKQAYRISPARLQRVRETFARYEGTNNFHNFTVRKAPNDPSAQRYIMSFTASPEPIIINDTEWLSLKVHGSSFMMHQIRKMVGLAALIVRCGTKPDILEDTLTNNLYSIPKAPGLGLLLERPVFTSYNKKSAAQFDRATIDFDKYEKDIEEFKRREIYNRIFREENKDHIFHSFFSHLDNYKEPIFLYLSSKGIAASGPAPRDVTTARSLSRKDRKGFKGKYHDRQPNAH